MQEDYTMVWALKQRQAIATVIDLMGRPGFLPEATEIETYAEAAE